MERHATNVDAELSMNATPEAGKPASFTIKVTDSENSPIKLELEHERMMHAVIVSEDLQSLGHIHPEDFSKDGITQEMSDSGEYPLEFTFPKAGKYVLAMNVLTSDGEFSKDFFIDVAGSLPMNTPSEDFRTKKTFQGIPEEGGPERYVKAVDAKKTETSSSDGYTVTLSAPSSIIAGQKVTLKHYFEKNGKPFSGFSIYLGAPMHFAVIKEGLNVALHDHGTLPGSSGGHEGHASATVIGPDVNLDITFPEPGVYQIFGQAKHQNKIVFTNFMVEVH